VTAKRTRANGEGSIFPYRSGFAAYVWVNKSDGKRQRKYVYGKTREEVHDKWIRLQQKAKDGPVATRVPTLAAFLAYWLEEVVRPNLAPATYVGYEMFTRLYLVPDLGARRLDRLQLNEVQRWINQISKTCQCCRQSRDAARQPTRQRCCAIGKCCQHLPAASTVKDLRATLRAALTHAITEELVTRNVAALLKLPVGRKKRRKAWHSDDARRFLECVRAQGDGLYAAYVLALVMGLRKGELLGLSWDDVDLDQGELRIAWQLQRIGRQLVRRETKTEESARTLPLVDICVVALKVRKEAQDIAPEEAGEAWQDFDNLVFTTRHGTPVEPRNFNRAWDARVAIAKVPRITVHDARRTCASLLVDLDVHPRIAMQILRHATSRSRWRFTRK
jgi:integrase